MKKIAKHQYHDCIIEIVPDDAAFSSCAQCLLDRPGCKDICLLEGNRYHVGYIKRFSWLRTMYRRIYFKLFSHYPQSKSK